jgi:hypothetical protein
VPLLTKGKAMAEKWTADHAPIEAYDRLHEQLGRAERLLAEIRNGKHSLPGALVQIDRYFDARGKSVNDAMRGPQPVPGNPVAPREDGS